MTESRFSSEEVCIDKNANLQKYPSIEPIKFADDIIVFGDLHANALKLIWLLIKHNRLQITPEQYEELKQIYIIIAAYVVRLSFHHYQNKLTNWETKLAAGTLSKNNLDSIPRLRNFVAELAKHHDKKQKKYKAITTRELDKCPSEEIKTYLDRFRTILREAPVVSNAPVLILGDDVRDRSRAGDFLLIWVYEALANKNITYLTMFSNHGLSCLKGLEGDTPLKNYAYPNLFNVSANYRKQYQSFNSTAILIRRGILDEKKIRQQFRDYWRYKQKLYGYYVNENTVTIFSHAPIGLKTMQHAANELAIEYADNTVPKFKDTITAINKKYRAFIKQNQIFALSKFKELKFSSYSFIPFNYYLLRTAWTRRFYGADGDVIPENHPAFQLRAVHAHHRFEDKFQAATHCLSLDDSFGKGKISGTKTSVALRLPQNSTTSFFVKPHQPKPSVSLKEPTPVC